MTTQKHLVYAHNLALTRGQRVLFKQLTFELQAGQAIHLSGPNGSGKTSLFKVLTGSLSPDSGILQILGKNIVDFETEDYQNLFYLGHQTAIKNELTVLENLRLNSELFDQVNTNDEQLHATLSALRMSNFHKQLTGKLSVGQKRRVMLARLWLTIDENKTSKSLWLLDEPLTALDTEVIHDLQILIDKHLSFGGAVIFTSHQDLELSHPIQSVVLGLMQDDVLEEQS